PPAAAPAASPPKLKAAGVVVPAHPVVAPVLGQGPGPQTPAGSRSAPSKSSQDTTRVMGADDMLPSVPGSSEDVTHVVIPSKPRLVPMPQPKKPSADAISLATKPAAASALNGRGILIVILLIAVVAAVGFLALYQGGK